MKIVETGKYFIFRINKNIEIGFKLNSNDEKHSIELKRITQPFFEESTENYIEEIKSFLELEKDMENAISFMYKVSKDILKDAPEIHGEENNKYYFGGKIQENAEIHEITHAEEIVEDAVFNISSFTVEINKEYTFRIHLFDYYKGDELLGSVMIGSHENNKKDSYFLLIEALGCIQEIAKGEMNEKSKT